MKVLRPYQAKAIEAIQRDLETYSSTMGVLATGLGKTVIATKLISEFPLGNTLFLAHTTELIDQAADKLAHELGYRPAVEMGLRAASLDMMFSGGMCVVGSVQSMSGEKRLRKYQSHPFGLIIVDECHHATSSSYRKVIEYFREINPQLKVVGLTATPRRGDGTALGTVFDHCSFQMEIVEGISDGWLVPIRQQSVVVEGLNFDGIKTRKNMDGEADFAPGELEEILMAEEVIHQMAKPAVEMLGNRPALVFTASVKHAHAMANVIRRYDHTAAAIDGETPKEQRAEIIRQFCAGNIQYLCNCSVLTEGFDAPNCTALVMGRPTKSVSLYTQMLGRGLRPLPGTVDGIEDAEERKLSILTSLKSECLVLDFAGVSQHKLVSSYDVLGGNYDVETRELAAREGLGKDPTEMLEQAQAVLAMERAWDKRKAIVAQEAAYGVYDVDPFGGESMASMGSTRPTGGATEAQVSLLIKLGVHPDTAREYGKRQASAVIDSLRTTRCTQPQAKQLQRYGINPQGIGMERASQIIDAIAANNWTLPNHLRNLAS